MGLAGRAQGARRRRCGDIVDDEQRRDRLATPMRLGLRTQIPKGSGGAWASAALALLDNAPALPASRRLASAHAALETRHILILRQAPSLLNLEEFSLLNLKWYDSLCAGQRLIMIRMLLHWIITALAVWLTSLIVPGIYVSGPAAALIAAIAIGLANATIGAFLKIITFPITIITFGVFWLVINGIMLKLASVFVPGFHIQGFAAAFWGAIVISMVNILLKWMVLPRRHD